MRPDGTRGLGLFAYLRSLESTNGDRRDVIARVFQGTVNRMQNGYLLRDVINKVNDIHFTSQGMRFILSAISTKRCSVRCAMRRVTAGEFYTPRALVKFIITVVGN
jgi:type I restriction enzyme M protein